MQKAIKKIFVCFILTMLSPTLPAQNWQGFGAGTDWEVLALYNDTVDNVLYMGGSFNYVSGQNIRGVAMYNGTTWSGLGSGVTDPFSSIPGNTWAIERYNNEIYIGGVFYEVGGIHSPVIARWNGTTWDSLPVHPFERYGGGILDMMVYNNELYVSGNFDTIAGFPAWSIAKWNGSTWSNVGTPFPYSYSGFLTIQAMAVYNNELYVGGAFHDTAQTVWNIARWDGIQWKPVGTGARGNIANVNSMVIYNNELYVAGLFPKSAGNAGNCIMKWDGTTWHDVGGGTGGNSFPQIHELKVYNNELYAVGVFQTAGDVPADRIAKWNGTEWCGLGSTFDNNILCIETYNNEIFVAGGFWTIDGDTATKVAKWTGGSYVDTCGVVGVNEITREISISVYPNPFTSSATFELAGLRSPATLVLFNQVGQEVKRIETITAGRYELSRDELSSGIYFYRLTDHQGTTARGKLVIQ